MTVTLTETLAANALTPDQIELAELYSCFPCIPKMARRILGWPAERPASVVGGLTFGGGPIGNYMSHAVAQAALRLREGSGPALLFGNGGFATHNHAIVLTRAPLPGTRLPQDFDRQAQADAMRGPATPLDEGYTGPGAIETYTVLYDRSGTPGAGGRRRPHPRRRALPDACAGERQRDDRLPDGRRGGAGGVTRESLSLQKMG